MFDQDINGNPRGNGEPRRFLEAHLPASGGLEGLDLTLLVANAQHIKTVPGRKTDVKDAQWIADLLRHGLLRGSYIPDRPQRELRELVRYRRSCE